VTHNIWSQKWGFFDGSPENFNIAHECVDRHPGDRTAIRIKFDDGKREVYTFKEISRLTSQFANMLERIGVDKKEPVAIMLPPSLEFYVSLLGTIKRGAVAIPCSPLFGLEALAFRIKDSGANTLIANKEQIKLIDLNLVSHLIVSEEVGKMIQGESEYYETGTSADDPALVQYSSGTTGTPKSVICKHKAIVVQAPLLVYLKDESYFCPSSPAWGHGIWYGTIGPLIFGTSIGVYSGKFNPEVVLEALEEFEVTVIAAAPTVYRMLINSGKIDNYTLRLKMLLYTGEFMEKELTRFLLKEFDAPIIGAYGSTELGPILLSSVTKLDDPKLGSLGMSLPGLKVAVLDEEGNELPPGEVGQISVWRKGRWLKAGDAAYIDEDGYFWYKGRVDDIIISGGYTIGPDEIENVLLKHPAISEVGVIGVPDKERGKIVKAIIKLNPGFEPTEELKKRLKDYIKGRLSKHEYPRKIEFVKQLPKTADGKIKRKELREREPSVDYNTG